MIWLIGANGMLGKQIAQELENNDLTCIKTDLELDITKLQDLATFAAGKDITWIINCSAYTNVDKAESDRGKTMSINADGVENIARIARKLLAKVIHFSTDYVFDGELDRPYEEDDETNPLSVYAKSKLAGENCLRNRLDDWFIFRISWLYGPHGPNFVKTMLRLFNEKDEVSVVADQLGSPTYTGQLSKNIAALIKSDSENFGLYHYSDEGFISWFDFANKIKEIASRDQVSIGDVVLKPITAAAYPTPAKRPLNSRLNKQKVKKVLNFEILDWKENLENFLSSLRIDTEK